MNAEELMQKWEPVIARSDHIFTWSGRGEMSYLAERASQASIAIELGVYMGASSFVMLSANPRLKLYSCDPFMVAGTRKVTELFLKEFIEQGRCEIVPMFTYESAEHLKHLRGLVDFCFIDAGHAYENLFLDIQSYLPLLKTGGILSGHDYDTNPDNDVTKAVKALLPGHTQPVSRIWEYVKV